MHSTPGRKSTIVNVDADTSEWKEEDLVAKNGDYRLFAKSDEKFLYLMAEVKDFRNETVYIPMDTIQGQGNTTYNGLQFDSAADFLVVLSGKDNSTVLVDPYYDVTYYQYAVNTGQLSKEAGHDQKNTGRFTQITQVLSSELKLPETGKVIPFRMVDTGKLQYGNANPDSPDCDSLSDFCENNGRVEIRIPWLLLNVMDPSSKKIIGDLYKNNGIAAEEAGAFRLGIAPSTGASASMGEYSWQKWDTPAYHERLKKSYYIIQNTFLSIPPAHVTKRTPFEVFWVKWNQTSFSKIATWFPIQPVLNYLIAFLLSVILYFFLALLYIHFIYTLREHAKKKIKSKIKNLVNTYNRRTLDLKLSDIASPRRLFSHNGLCIINDLLAESRGEHRQLLRKLFYTRLCEHNIAKRLRTRNVQDLILVIRLVGELRLQNLGSKIKKLMYAHKKNMDLQYQGFLTLSLLASYDDIVEICMDENYVQNLSFRCLQEVLKAYTGNKPDLYRALLHAPDAFVRRICIKRIGIEQFTEFAGDIYENLDPHDYNTLLDAVRTLGQLKYLPAADRIRGFLSDERWEIRGIAVSAIGAIDNERYVDEITGCLHDSEWQVRQKAATALMDYSDTGNVLEKVKATGDRYAFEILDYMIRNHSLMEKAV